MLFNNLSSLSWQTGIIKFRNRSLKDVKKTLELQYGVEIFMYHELLKQKILSLEELNEIPQEEIKLELYMDYELDSDNLVIKGLMH